VNGLLDAGSYASAARLAQELLALSVERRGRLAFEYYFPWGGGRPGWTSAMAQAAAMTALARIWEYTGERSWLDAALRLEALLRASPPSGVRVRTSHGAEYLLYSQLPRMFVGNAMASTLISLHDFADATGDAGARALFEDGLAEADATLSTYDTRARSLYYRTPTGPGDESDLHYHDYFGYLLRRLCARVKRDPYCALGARFREYDEEPVELEYLHAHAGRREIAFSFWASKIGAATVRLLDARGKQVATTSLATRGGRVRATLRRPCRAGIYTIAVRARSLNGIASDAERDVAVRRRSAARS
jgi:hypothetical protein